MTTEGELVQIIQRHGDRREVRRRDRLHRAGDPLTHVWLVSAGWFGRYRASPTGIESFTGIFVTGDIVGLDALGHERLDDEITALAAGVVLRLPLDAVRRIVERGGPAALELATLIAADAGYLREGLFAIGTQSSRERLTLFLLQTYRRLLAAGLIAPDAERFPLPLTQAQLGAVTGITGVHINRVLRVLREEGPFDVGHGVVRVTDLPALRRTLQAG